jgi:hypothetical protein
MLAEAAFVAVSTRGPMRAFYEPVRARRGRQIAIVAVARKLAVLFWHLLTREQDYAFQRPSLTRKKLRGLELRAGAQRHPGRRDLPTNNTDSPRPRTRTLRTRRTRLPPARHRLEGHRADTGRPHDLTFIRPQAPPPSDRRRPRLGRRRRAAAHLRRRTGCSTARRITRSSPNFPTASPGCGRLRRRQRDACWGRVGGVSDGHR